MDISVIVPLYNNGRYIGAALDSALDQGVQDIEIIVVDDGSTDDGADIVAEYARAHQEVRLIRQPNSGVSAARNTGLDHASGDFIAFLDSDDEYLPGALADMLSIARKREADLVIGESRSVGPFKTDKLLQSERLSKESLIPRDSPDLIYNFSNCNKLFRKTVIDEHGLRFKPFRHAEDGLFLYEFVSKCGLITGCPRYVYAYKKRLSLDSRSTLKSLDHAMFQDVMSACEEIAGLTRDWSEEFRDELNMRILRVTIIGEYYRRLWLLDDALIAELFSTAARYRSLVGEGRWEQIRSMNVDLGLGDSLRTKDEILASPLITVLIPKGLDQDAYLGCLGTLYYQLCPNFEVLASSSYESSTPEDFRGRENFSFFAGDPLAAAKNLAKGRYLQLVREGCVFNESSLRLMATRAMASSAGFVSARPMAYRDGRKHPFPALDGLFAAKAIAKCREDEAYRLSCDSSDAFLANKLFDREQLIGLADSCEEPGLDGLLASAYRCLSYERLNNVVIGIASGFDESLLSGSTSCDGDASRSEKRRSDRALAKAEGARRTVYSISSRILPIDKKKVLFLSDIRASLGGNYAPIKPLLETRGYEIVELFQSGKRPSKSRKKQARLGFELATAGSIVLEDYYGATGDISVRGGQELMQLWHACGAFKKFAWSRAGGSEGVVVHPSYRKYTKAIVSSEAIRGNYAEAYGIDISRVRATGIPRTDAFFEQDRPKRVRSFYEERYPVLKGRKAVLIAPTYRGTKVTQASYDIERLSLGKLHERLGDEYVLITKWHPAMQEHLKRMESLPAQRDRWQRIHDELGAVGDFLLDLSDERDINDLLMCCDVLVTDYSSVIFEYALMNKPVVYFWYDVNEYVLGRGTYYDMDEYVYGRIAYRTEDLADAIMADDLYEDKRAAFLDKFMSACDGHSAERAVDWLLSSS